MISCIGVGPGDLGFLTRRGQVLIEQADVVAGFTAVVDLIRSLVNPNARVITMSYKDQVERLDEVARLHRGGGNCVVVFMGDLHFSGFQLLERVERACQHEVETIPGISSAQILASRCRVCFDETTFITFHRRGDITPFQEHLVHVLEDNRNAIVIPRPWDFMPATIAHFLLAKGITPDHPVEVWENLTRSEAAWKGLLGNCSVDFSDMSIMLIRARNPLPNQPVDLAIERPIESQKKSDILVNRSTRGQVPPLIEPNEMAPSATEEYGIVIAGHGSRDPEGVREFEQLVNRIRERAGRRRVNHGFLEFAQPTIDQAVRSIIDAGEQRVAIVPLILLAATHAKNDMPVEVLTLQQEFPKTKLHYGAALHLHSNILRLIRQRIVEAEARSPRTIRRSDSCLVVVGRGTTDPDANSDVSKLARLLQEGLGFGGLYVCYAGTAKPLVADGLEKAIRLGFERVVVAPFFLFTGVLVKRIYAAVNSIAAHHPGIEFLKVDYLGNHELLADAFLERAAESVTGKAVMNCSLCKYRVQIVGYEKEVGAPQQGHHFHVRGGTLEVKSSRRSSIAETRTPNAEVHPIEEESFRIIEELRDWRSVPEPHKFVLQRLIHASGDPDIADDIFISPGAIEVGIKSLSQRIPIVTDVTMVQSGLRRALLESLGVPTVCTVHDEETRLLAESAGITRSAAGIRRARDLFGNDLLLAIGDAPTAIEEAVRLVTERHWRPHLIIGLPVGFVGTRESKEKLRSCLRVPRITNRGTRGGSPWAAAVVNAMLIQAAREIPTR